MNLKKQGSTIWIWIWIKVDFIKVVTKQEKEDFTFILQIAVSEKETQDVAVILVSKDEKKKLCMQYVGDKICMARIILWN
ncbi:MAG: hypothetical protein U5K54_23155 [Cytophagales bacterium]|nr:hypothetical protein [Cytophagales bacterium]